MKGLLKYLGISVKGACMGAADVIPGVSGGTIAFIMGIYDKLVGSIAAVNGEAVKMLLKGRFRDFWKHINGGFLVALAAGIGISVVSLAGLMQMLLNDYPIQTWAFFFGLIVASSIFILRGISNWKIRDGLFIALGIILGVVICTLSPTETPDALWFIFLSGAIAICAMILPGISGSFILLILGKYQTIMESITNCVANAGALWGASGSDAGAFWTSFWVIAVFLIGAAVGILSFSKLLHWLLARWNRETLIVLAGFIIGSLVKVWPWSNMEAIVCSQFPEVAQLGTAAEKLGKHTELYSGEEIQQLMKTYHDSIERCIPMVEKHIWGAIIFAVIGFSLVTGIELAGKYITRKKASKA